MSNITGNEGINNNSLMDVLMALKQNIMRDLNVAEVCKVVEIRAGSICIVNPINNSNQRLYTYNLYNSTVSVGDLVLVIFTNTDNRLNINKINNEVKSQNVESKDLHSINYGVIVGKSSGSGGDVKLYDTTGQNTDGAMTQKASTDNFALKTDVHDAILTISRNGIQIGTFSANAGSNASINIPVPTSASDVNALPDTTKYAANSSLTFDSTTYVITLSLKDQDGNTIGTNQTITLPIAKALINASYNTTTGIITLTANDSTTINLDLSQVITNKNDIATINGKIPSQASSSNQLADKDFVNSSINALAAYYITRNGAGDPFRSKAELLAATTFYNGGSTRIPTTNDYCIVLADESQGSTVSGYTSFTTTDQYVGYYIFYNGEETEVTTSNKDNLGIVPGTTIAYSDLPTTRYSYQGGTYPSGQWEFQYVINETPMTAAQIAAINSGITATLLSQIQNDISSLNTSKADKTQLNNYLPLSAGSSKSLTGDLYISKLNNEGQLYLGKYNNAFENYIMSDAYGNIILYANKSFYIRTALTSNNNGILIEANSFIPESTENINFGTGNHQWQSIWGKYIMQNGNAVANASDIKNSTISIYQGGVLKGTFTLNQSTNGNIYLDAGGGAASTDVQINGTSIVANSIANIITNGVYNASTNPIATMSDVPTPVIIETTTSANDSPTITSSQFSDIVNAYKSGKSVLLRWYHTTGTLSTPTYDYYNVIGVKEAQSFVTGYDIYIDMRDSVYIVDDHASYPNLHYTRTYYATKSGNNTFSGTNNFTGTFQIGGKSLLDTIYPVGTIYYGDANSTSPASWLGGTWERLPANYAIWTALSGAYDGTNGKIAAGLPNIKGTFGNSFNNASTNYYHASGAFSTYTDSTHKKGLNGSSINNTGGAYSFDAHNSNSIYADENTTVQPPAIKVYAWRRTS